MYPQRMTRHDDLNLCCRLGPVGKEGPWGFMFAASFGYGWGPFRLKFGFCGFVCLRLEACLNELTGPTCCKVLGSKGLRPGPEACHSQAALRLPSNRLAVSGDTPRDSKTPYIKEYTLN